VTTDEKFGNRLN